MKGEKEYLAAYNIHDYDIPLVGVDAVLFTYHGDMLKLLLVERRNHPDKNKWALPGGFVDKQSDKTLEDTVLRKIQEKTGVEPPYLEQLKTYGNALRDKRGWSITVCYTALISHQVCAPHVVSVSDVAWVAYDELSNYSLGFDHLEIITHARERLKQKSLYSVIPAYALPQKFTLPELQNLHEVLIGKPLQKKSFRRRIEQAGLFEDTGEKRTEKGRPATLYRMKDSSACFTFVRNLEQ